MCFYTLDFLCLCAISSEEADYKDEIEIASLFNIPQASIPGKRQEYKGFFIHSVKFQNMLSWSSISNEAQSPVGHREGKLSSPHWGKGNVNAEPKD